MSTTLTSEQLLVVNAPKDQNLKVVAVPGSGKSTVLIHRIEKLLNSRVNADQIVVIMFNDSAVQNFKNDLNELDFFHLPEVKTFHSYAKKLCYLLSKQGYMEEQTLVTSDKELKTFYRDIFQSAVPEHVRSIINYKSNDALSDFISFVDLVKTTLASPEAVFDEYQYPYEKRFYISLFYQTEEIRNSNNIQFFIDLIYDVICITKENIDAYHAVSNKHSIVIVDEFQDANALSYHLLKLLAGTKACINVVGDDDQSIYQFIGSKPDFIISEVEKDFKDIALYTLSYTFRYGTSVSLMANNVISQNNKRIDKLCVSHNTSARTSVSVAQYPSQSFDFEQYDLMYEIAQWIKYGQYKDIAILFRNYSRTEDIEIALLKNNHPYFISKQNNSVLHGDEAKFIRACLTLLNYLIQNELELKSKGVLVSIKIYLSSFVWGLNDAVIANIVELISEFKYDLAIASAKKLKIKPELKTVLNKRITALSKTVKSRIPKLNTY